MQGRDLVDSGLLTPVLPAHPWHRRAFLALLLLGLLLRLAFAVEVVARDVDLETRPPRDMWLYATEARSIVEGDLLLRGTPDLMAAHVDKGLGASTYMVTPEGRARLRRYGREPLIQAPLYPYLLALSWWGWESFTPARLAQIGLSLLIPVLTWQLARAVRAREEVALGAMALLILHPTLVLYSAFLLRAILGTTLLLLAVLALARHVRSPTGRTAAWLGASVGLIHLGREIVPFLLPWLVIGLAGPVSTWRAGWRVRARHLLLAGAGFAALVAPLAVRNLLCGTSLLHTGSQSQLLMFFYNFQGADGLHLVRPDAAYVAAHVRPDASLLETLRAAIATHPTPGGFLLLLGRKLHGVLNGYEPLNNINPYLYQRWLVSLRLFPLSTTLLLTLAIPGLGVLLRRWRRAWPVLAGCATVMAFCLAGVALARYRLLILPYFAVCAASGAAAVWGLVRSRRAGRVLLAGCALAAAGWVAWPRGRTEYTPLMAYAELGTDYQEVAKPHVVRELALLALEELVSQDPTALRRLEPQQLRSSWELRDWARQACAQAGDQERARAIARANADLFQAAADGLPLAGADSLANAPPAEARRCIALAGWAAASCRAAGDTAGERRWLLRLAAWVPGAREVQRRLEELSAGDRSGAGGG